MTFTIGEMLHNRYRVVKLLAQGGFGTLYRAWDTALERPCVLKENLADTPDGQRQFLHEAKILANLSHPNLPRVTDFFLGQAGKQYLVMDYVEGQDLQEILEEQGKPFDEQQVLQWAVQLCEALNYLHSQKPPIIHRDIKPANIQLTPSGRIVLIDFGIAKVFDPKQKTTLGAQAISPGFSPYEQYGKGKTDARSDIYSLGATLYTLLTAQEPPESIQRVVNDPLVLPRQANPSLSMRTSAAIVRALQLDPTQRFQKILDFKKALTPPPSVTPIPVSTPNPLPVQSLPPQTMKTPPWGWIALVSCLLIVIIVLLIQNRNQTDAVAQNLPVSTIAVSPDNHQQVTQQLLKATHTIKPQTTPAEKLIPTLTPLVHIVQKGETCSEIAEAFDVSIREIIAENASLDPDCSLLFAGQPLLIPQSKGPVNTPAWIKPTHISVLKITQVSEKDQMISVKIPAGEFKMGASDMDEDAEDFEKPRHIVYLTDYWIDLIEITNDMYAGCVEQGVCAPPGKMSSKTRSYYFRDQEYRDFPVLNVTWDDADRYCKWAGRRLPSEAEWEKAARGASGLLFPWGNSPPSMRLANFGSLFGDTLTTGSFPEGASPFGILDMAGNVAEWVFDWYGGDGYAGSVYRNPTGPAQGEFKMIRGGSWYNQPVSLRSSSRLWNYPTLQSDTVGFRCAR